MLSLPKVHGTAGLHQLFLPVSFRMGIYIWLELLATGFSYFFLTLVFRKVIDEVLPDSPNGRRRVSSL